MDGRDARGKDARSKPFDPECRLVVGLDEGNIRLVNIHFQLHALEILGERKQHWRLK